MMEGEKSIGVKRANQRVQRTSDGNNRCNHDHPQKRRNGAVISTLGHEERKRERFVFKSPAFGSKLQNIEITTSFALYFYVTNGHFATVALK